MKRNRQVAAILWVVSSAVGCDARESNAVDTVETWELSPRLEIGVVEGDPTYEFASVVSSLVLPDGRIAVADGASQELRFFDGQGQHLGTVGGRGSGPGEFQWLTRVYHHGPDSLLAFDFAKVGLVQLDAAGNYVRMIPAESISGDSVFKLDVWLYRDFWIEGTLYARDRPPIRSIIDRLPAFDDESAYRFGRRDANGNLWIREPLTPVRAVWTWTIVDSAGSPIGRIETPQAFTIQDIGPDYVVGRWRDANDVEFVRVYDIRTQQTRAALPGWFASSAAREVQNNDETDLAELRSVLRQLVGAQERHYASNSSYTLDASVLNFEVPEDMVVEIVFAFQMGWSAVAGYAGSGRVCGMAVGLATPPGWPEGAVRCG